MVARVEACPRRAARCPEFRKCRAILLRVIQAIGLTSNTRKARPPAVDDVSFEARAGHVTALLGAPGAGKTTALKLMLELQQGRGVTYFRGRPLHRIAHPSREVGVLMGEVPGHPARTVRGQLRMLCAAAGVPVRRADEVLEVVGLVSLRDERLGTLSRGMDRRLGLACVLLSDPHTLVLDDPADGLCARERRWLHGILRAHATQGGTVLFATDDPKEAARTADRVVTLEQGRLVADQEAADFARTRLRPRVAVRSPHAARLGSLLTKEARTAQRSVEVVREEGNRLSVYGSTCADIGEIAFRHGILVHQLADETGDMGPAPTPTAEEGEHRTEEPPPRRRTRTTSPPPAAHLRTPGPEPAASSAVRTAQSGRCRHRLPHGGRRSRHLGPPGRPSGQNRSHTPAAPAGGVAAGTPLPPAALGAGLLGAVAFGEEFRHPALATDRGTVPRRLGLLTAKLLVASGTALMLAFLTVGCDLEVLYLVYGRELTGVPSDWLSLSASWLGLVVGCAWAGVLAAGIFRSTAAGLAAVLAVPIVVVPLVQKVLQGPSVRTAAGFPERLRELVLMQWPFGGERYLAAGVRVLAQPVGGALMLSLAALLCTYLLTTLRSRVR